MEKFASWKPASPGVQHGISAQHPFYACWYNMLQRCTDPENPRWERYGGRGITISPAWRSFAQFKLDMFATWQKGLSLDRIDNDRGYSKENCRWATPAQQGQNKDSNILTTEAVQNIRFLRQQGVSVAFIAKKYGISASHCSRVSRGLKWK